MSNSEGVAQGLGHGVGVKIARRGGPDERTLAVLVIIPAGVPGQLMTQVDAQVDHRLVVLVLRGAVRLQDVELRNAAVDIGDACRPTLTVVRLSNLKRTVAIPKLVWLV